MASIFDTIYAHKDYNKVAIYYKKHSITYKCFCNETLRLVTFFKTIGIKKGDIVTLVLPNIPECILSIYALNYIGAKINILHFLSSFNIINSKMDILKSNYVILLDSEYIKNKEFINKSKNNFIFVNPTNYENIFKKIIYRFKIKKPNSKLSNVFNLSDYKKYNIFDTKNNKIDNLDNKETSFYIHSGGTTSDPKIIELSNNAVEFSAINLNKHVTKKDISSVSISLIVPVFHCFGLCTSMHNALGNNASLYVVSKFNTEEIVKAINDNKLNSIIGVYIVFKKLLEAFKKTNCNLDNLNECFMGSDSHNITFITEFNDYLKSKNAKNAILAEGYGLTETAGVVSTNTINNYKLGSVGKPVGTVKVKIIDENNNPLECNKIGEICIAGDTIMNCYYDSEESNQETVLFINNEKYIKSGDLGYINEEGYLFFEGRKKRIYKIAGITIFPVEVENIVQNLKEIVSDASLEFIDNKSEKPYLVLFVVKTCTCNVKTEAEMKDLIFSEIKKNTIKYNWPKDIIFIDSLPRTTLGKVDHKKLISYIS